MKKCLLYGAERAVLFQAFNGRNLCICGRGNRGQARACCHAIHQHRAGAALTLAAAVLCACELKPVSENKKKWFVIRRSYAMVCAVDMEKEITHLDPPEQGLTDQDTPGWLNCGAGNRA
jgi:hypothetical protein